MYADVERVRFDAAHHYLRVVQQQGRVMMAAEANEQVAILLHHLRALAVDLFGGRGTSAVPDGAGGFRAGPGFEIGHAVGSDSLLSVAPGHYWVGGRLCELEAATTYTGQPDHPPSGKLPDSGTFLVYLDAWERHVGVAEEPGLEEIALGGPDSCSRTKLVWQVRLRKVTDGATVSDVRDTWPEHEKALGRLADAGRLRADVDREERDRDPCLATPTAGYTGGENQLLRVEIHTGTPGELGGAPTFTWAYDNASVSHRLHRAAGRSVTLSQAPRDVRKGFDVGTRVEVLSDHQILRGERGRLTTVERVDDADDCELTLADDGGVVLGEKDEKAGRWALLRRWDHTDEDLQPDGARTLTEGVPLTLAHGVQITFATSADAGRGDEEWIYRPGDYWTIPVRVASGDVVWPRDRDGTRQWRAPEGVEHGYAPLALLTLGGAGGVTDMRDYIRPVGVGV